MSANVVKSSEFLVLSKDHEERCAGYVEGMIVTNLGKATRMAGEEPGLIVSEGKVRRNMNIPC